MTKLLIDSIPTQPPPIASAIIPLRWTPLVSTIGKIENVRWRVNGRVNASRNLVLTPTCHPTVFGFFLRPPFEIDIEMRIGTWNVNNRRMTDNHRDLLVAEKCDVWLLTELNRSWADEARTKVLHFHSHLSKGVMGPNQHWAAILSVAALDPLEDPHPASAVAKVNGITFCSTILPWRGVKTGSDPWTGSNHEGMTASAIDALLGKLPKINLVWGGDWNHSLNGKEHAGSMGGRKHLLEAIEKLGLKVPTSVLSHRGDYCTAIDHIGVPLSWAVDRAHRIDAEKLSDHDAYVVEVSSR